MWCKQQRLTFVPERVARWQGGFFYNLVFFWCALVFGSGHVWAVDYEIKGFCYVSPLGKFFYNGSACDLNKFTEETFGCIRLIYCLLRGNDQGLSQGYSGDEKERVVSIIASHVRAVLVEHGVEDQPRRIAESLVDDFEKSFVDLLKLPPITDVFEGKDGQVFVALLCVTKTRTLCVLLSNSDSYNDVSNHSCISKIEIDCFSQLAKCLNTHPGYMPPFFEYGTRVFQFDFSNIYSHQYFRKNIDCYKQRLSLAQVRGKEFDLGCPGFVCCFMRGFVALRNWIFGNFNKDNHSLGLLADENRSGEQYKQCDDRLKTFKDVWPEELQSAIMCKEGSMAELGFYYIKKPDVVKCYKCAQVVCSWEVNDNPLDMHVKFSPYCGFLKGILDDKGIAEAIMAIESKQPEDKEIRE